MTKKIVMMSTYGLNLPLDMKVLKERYQKEFRPYLLNEAKTDSYFEMWIEIIEEAHKSKS